MWAHSACWWEFDDELNFYESLAVVDSSWNVMAHGATRRGVGWRGNWRMEWVVSTLHTISEHGVSSIRVQLKCDGKRWRMERGSEGETGEWSGQPVLFTLPPNMVYPALESSWNVMAKGDAHEGKWRGKWWMEWETSILHTTAEDGYPAVESSWNVMAHGDALEGKWRDKLANGVGSQYSSHYLGIWCIQN